MSRLRISWTSNAGCPTPPCSQTPGSFNPWANGGLPAGPDGGDQAAFVKTLLIHFKMPVQLPASAGIQNTGHPLNKTGRYPVMNGTDADGRRDVRIGFHEPGGRRVVWRFRQKRRSVKAELPAAVPVAGFKLKPDVPALGAAVHQHTNNAARRSRRQIGRASCRERV